MKKLKIKYVDYLPRQDNENYYFTRLLRRFYEVELCEDPDYIIYSVYGQESGGPIFQEYDCIRIFHTIENISFDNKYRIPWYRKNVDFNFENCDYAIAYDHMDLGDRYIRYPYYLFNERNLAMALNKHNFTEEELKSKNKFCNFVYSNNWTPAKPREEFFHKLNEYKIVDSGGKLLNNIGGPVVNKLLFQKDYKFTIAFENALAPGYTTEKIIDAFASKTIPIYWGNPEIVKDFNSNAFINCHEYDNFEEVIKRIIEIDNNDSLFMEIMREPIVANYNVFKEENEARLIEFFRNIFDQPIEAARRR